MSDIHQGFQDDRREEAAVLMSFLDSIDGLESVQEYKQRMLAAAPVKQGERRAGLQAQHVDHVMRLPRHHAAFTVIGNFSGKI